MRPRDASIQWIRLATTTGIGVMQLNQCHQTALKQNLFHLGQETPARGFLALTGVLEIGKAHLTHSLEGLQGKFDGGLLH